MLRNAWNGQAEAHMGNGPAVALSISGDEKLAAIVDREYGLALWNLEQRQRRPFAPVHADAFASTFSHVALDHLGQRLATRSIDRRNRIWDVETGQPLVEIEEPGPTTSIRLSADGRRLLSTSRGGSVALWDAMSGALVYSDATADVARFSHDGSVLAVSSGGGGGRSGRGVDLVDAATGTIRRVVIPPSRNVGWTNNFVMAFSPAGAMLALSGTVLDREVVLIDVATGAERGRVPGRATVDIAFSSSGTRMLTAHLFERVVRIWDVKTLTLLGELMGGGEPVGQVAPLTTIAFVADGRRIVGAPTPLVEAQQHPPRLWLAFPTTRELVEHARAFAPRCLTPEQRRRYLLPEAPPHWCIDMDKWPYQGDAWKHWLQEVRAGRQPAVPASVTARER